MAVSMVCWKSGRWVKSLNAFYHEFKLGGWTYIVGGHESPGENEDFLTERHLGYTVRQVRILALNYIGEVLRQSRV